MSQEPSPQFLSKAEHALYSLIKAHLPSESELWLFGSRARGTHAWFSDYDVLIKNDVSGIATHKQAISTILDALDESWIPFKLDLISFDSAIELNTNKLLQSNFYQQVMETAVPWRVHG